MATKRTIAKTVRRQRLWYGAEHSTRRLSVRTLQDPDAETSPTKRRGALKPWDDGEEDVLSEAYRVF
jgi:hypothetical protein